MRCDIDPKISLGGCTGSIRCSDRTAISQCGALLRGPPLTLGNGWYVGREHTHRQSALCLLSVCFFDTMGRFAMLPSTRPITQTAVSNDEVRRVRTENLQAGQSIKQTRGHGNGNITADGTAVRKKAPPPLDEPASDPAENNGADETEDSVRVLQSAARAQAERLKLLETAGAITKSENAKAMLFQQQKNRGSGDILAHSEAVHKNGQPNRDTRFDSHSELAIERRSKELGTACVSSKRECTELLRTLKWQRVADYEGAHRPVRCGGSPANGDLVCAKWPGCQGSSG